MFAMMFLPCTLCIPFYFAIPQSPELTRLCVLAVGLDVIAAGLSQNDVIPEVTDLHELVVEDLVLAGLAGDVVLLVL